MFDPVQAGRDVLVDASADDFDRVHVFDQGHHGLEIAVEVAGLLEAFQLELFADGPDVEFAD